MNRAEMQKYCRSVAVHIDLSQCHDGARFTNGVNTIKLIQTLSMRETPSQFHSGESCVLWSVSSQTVLGLYSTCIQKDMAAVLTSRIYHINLLL